MQSSDYQCLFDIEDGFWWFEGMRLITSALLDPLCKDMGGRAILDAGCGTGFNLEWLRRYTSGSTVHGVDISDEAIDFCRRRGASQVSTASVTSLPFRESNFDLVTSFDVLVQLPNVGDDQLAANEMFRVIRPGGLAFVRVAAYEAMKSGHDEALGTHKRYTSGQLSRIMRNAGFNIVRATYANSLLLPVAAVHRLILKPIRLVDPGSDTKPLPPGLVWLNPALRTILAAEAAWLRRPRASLRVGLSAICVARKPSS